MEQMAADGLIDGILDLTTHEITQSILKAVFPMGKMQSTVLSGGGEKVPLVVSVGGLDFIDFQGESFRPAWTKESI